MAPYDVSSAKRLVSRLKEQAKYTFPLILVSFSSIEVKTEYLKSFFRYIKSKPFRIEDLSQPNGGLAAMDTFAEVSQMPIFIGEHMNKQSLECYLRVRKLLKTGFINKFVVKGGYVWIRVKIDDPFVVVRSVIELSQIVPESTVMDRGGGSSSNIVR